MIKPEWFDESAFDIPPVLWTVDDVWLSGHVVRKSIDIRTTEDPMYTPVLALQNQIAPLYKAEIEGADRLAANQACVRYFQETYGIWLPRDQAA